MSSAFQSHIQKLTPDLFGFGFSLIPDDLQAQQLVIDATAAFVVEKKDLMKAILEETQDELRELLIHEAKRQLCRNMFQIGKRRCEQLSELCQNVNKFQSFYKLRIHERAILLLKQKQLASFEDIEFITGLERLEVISRLNRAREELLALDGQGSHGDMIPT